MYKPHTHCRACGYAKPGAQGIKSDPTDKLIEVMDLGIQPLANDFCKDGEPRSGYAPLKVLFCPRCTLAQLSVVVDPTILYRHYSYVTSPSQMMRDHFKNLITDIEHECKGNKVLEIGSNDGRLLDMMKRGGGYNVIGVDPAANLAAIAEDNGIHTHALFFGADTAPLLGKFDIVIARHVFCHVHDWHGFVKGLEIVSHPKTLICIEVPSAGDTIEHCEFDTIYHEHLSYLTIESVQALLKDTALRLHKVIRYEIHGGALLLMLRHKDSARAGDCEFTENVTQQHWEQFSKVAKERILQLQATVTTALSQGKRVAALGASAKSTVWISACHFTRKEIGFIADNTPQKQWTFSPGTDIPVVDPGAILREIPDYVIVWAWNYRKEILINNELARKKGVRFIFPVPTIEIV